MASASDIAQLAELSVPYIDKLFFYINESEKEKEAAAKLFKETADEIFNNLSILGKLRLERFKDYAINSPEVKKIINEDLKTGYTEQFVIYTRRFNLFNKKDNGKLIDKLTTALHKIYDIRLYAGKSTEELEWFTGFHPDDRLENIRKDYDDIRKILTKR
jgi:hypothetical protein